MHEEKITVNAKKGFNTSGIGIGNALKLNSTELEVEKIITNDSSLEIEIFKKAINTVSDDIKKLIAISDIFEAHLMIANDPIFKDRVINYINTNKVNAAYAIKHVTNSYLETFKNIYNPHLQERKADIIDVTNQILANVLNIELKSLNNINKDTILIANDLSPSETASLNLEYIKGLILFNSGITSHTAIIAKLNNIPLIINNELNFDNFKDNELTIIDANHNIIYQNPNEDTLNQYHTYLNDQAYYQSLLSKYQNKETYTNDNKRINLMLNINSIDDLDKLDNYQIDGIGLFRTEFLFMKGTPSLELQESIYRKLFNRFKDQSVTIRTFDLGGDKTIKGLNNPLEENPFLGVRGIRFALKNEDIFKIQIKALLKANTFGNLNIMLPMIATTEEFDTSKRIIKDVENELINEGYQINPYKLGIMIEVPIAALNANKLAKKVDFFSIGTNDLIQYLFAADRMNTNLSYLYQSLHPSLLSLIKMVASAANENNIEVSVCGEMAGDLFAVPLLLGAGIKNLSMSISRVLSVREKISNTNLLEASNLLNEAITLSSEDEVIKLIK
ncbi:MAG TPA: phosphoenolpyruvate--protein phosphotransferase [Acholeplasmataceae bacterium]|nr:phosphoenolpyruvate--protein phosphotransferase [Acholeplasmataceae bacterium]